MKRKIFLGLVGGLLIYEAVMLDEDDTPDTISGIFWGVSQRRPLVPFAMGMLMGHFFWQAAASGTGSSST